MTHNIPTELQRYVQERIIPQYAGFDKAHQIDHAEKVIEESLKLALHYEVDSAMVYTVAAYHDLGLCEDVNFIISFRAKYCWRMKLCVSGLPMNKCCR